MITYGREPAGTLLPAIGLYTAIGSESAPIIQFMDSMGWHDTAARAIDFFLKKQRPDGFMQNFNGYMLETGAVRPVVERTTGLYHVAIHVPKRSDLAQFAVRALQRRVRIAPTLLAQPSKSPLGARNFGSFKSSGLLKCSS